MQLPSSLRGLFRTGTDVPGPRAAISLDRALLCLDCETLYELVAHGSCPSCGSPVSWPVVRLLDRPPAPFEKAAPWPADAPRARAVAQRGATPAAPLPFPARKVAS